MSAVTVDGYVVWLAVKVVPVSQRYLSDRKEWRVATTTYHFRFFTRLMTPVITSFQSNNAIWQVRPDPDRVRPTRRKRLNSTNGPIRFSRQYERGLGLLVALVTLLSRNLRNSQTGNRWVIVTHEIKGIESMRIEFTSGSEASSDFASRRPVSSGSLCLVCLTRSYFATSSSDAPFLTFDAQHDYAR